MPETFDTEALTSVSLLTVTEDGDDFILGRPDFGIYVAVPEPGAVFIRALQAGRSIADATMQASENAGTAVDGADFLSGLAEAGLLATVVESDVLVTDGKSGPRRIKWIEGVSQRTARKFFGGIAWVIYGLAFILNITLIVAKPQLRPSFEHAWWIPDPVASALVLVIVSFVLGAFHEAWHWLAGRAVGIPAIFRVSYRGAFMVFETDLSQIVTVPRRLRYGPFLAGMALDSTVLAVVLTLRLSYIDGILTFAPWIDRMLAMLALVQVLSIMWQLAAVFMRSDVYAILANALKCHDLYRATWLTTKGRLWRLDADESDELAAIGGHDRKVAKWFGVVYLAGLLAMVWVILTFVIPFVVSMMIWLGGNLVNPAWTTVAFWEAFALVFLMVARYSAPALLAVRERKLRQEGRLR